MDPKLLLPLIPHPFKSVFESVLHRLETMEARLAAMEKKLPCLAPRG
jgi:hypothetical protein